MGLYGDMRIEEILEDYAPDNTIWSNEDERVNAIKNIIYTKLDEVDRRIIILYAELGSLRKLGKELGISASSAYLKIKQIKGNITDALT